MIRLTEITFDKPQFIVEVYRGFDIEFVKSLPNEFTDGEIPKIFFFFIGKEHLQDWYKPNANIIGFKVDNLNSVTEEYAKNFIERLYRNDSNILTNTINNK